ncbi:MAG: CPBP family intramembrane metalloprotease [Eggerthellaceae bacterium]|nr:CPBP family intramembrane metalloprotease [Eggerthellaceae bacterium]
MTLEYPPPPASPSNFPAGSPSAFPSAALSQEPPAPPSPQKALRRDVRNVVLVLLLVWLTMSLAPGIILGVLLAFSPEFQSAVFQSMNGTSINIQDVMENPLLDQLMLDAYLKYTLVLAMVCEALALLWLLLLRGKQLFTFDLVAVNQKVNLAAIVKILVLMLGVACVSSLIDFALTPLFEQAGLSLTEFMEETFSMIFSSPWGLVYVVVLGPIMEEIIFRGAILRKLAPYGCNFAIVVSALLFGLYHMFLLQAFNAFFLGILLAYVALRYSLKWSMVLHIVYNGIVTGISFLDVVGINPEIANWVIGGLCLVAAIMFLVLKRDEIPRIRQMGLPQIPHPFRSAFTNPFLVGFVVVFLGAGVLLLLPEAQALLAGL